jgi:hypothetical protein
MVLESIKKSYELRVALVTPPLSMAVQTPGASSMDKLHCPMNDRDLLAYFEPLSQDFGEAFGVLGGTSTTVPSVPKSIPVYHDLWATMTMNWSND